MSEELRDGWREHKGMDCPVAPETLVLVQMSMDGSQECIEQMDPPSPASDWRWDLQPACWDRIVAYKVVE